MHRIPELRYSLSELLIKNDALLLCHLERKYELGANVLRADDGNCLAVSADDLLDDRETESCSLAISASGGVALIEAVPDFGQVVAGYAAALVLDGDFAFSVPDRGFQLNFRAFFAEFDRIVEQVIDDLLDFFVIGVHAELGSGQAP